MNDYVTDAYAQLNAEYAEKKARLDANMALACILPTNGVTVSWIGEDGWDSEGNAKSPVEKICGVVPWIFHNKTAYKTAEHIAYRAPDSHKWTNGQGESTHSKYRNKFINYYFAALLDAFEPFMIDTVAWKGSRYAGSHFPDKCDVTQIKDYQDAKEIARGKYEVLISTSIGEHSYMSTTLGFYVDLPERGKVYVTYEILNGGHLLAPRAHGCERDSRGYTYRVHSWQLPASIRKATNAFKYGSGGDNTNCVARYLFASREDMLFSLGLKSENV